jgi:two-component system, sensor histidine kinase and response regulator
MLTNFESINVKSKRILLAEDSITFQRLAVGLLEKLGHSIVIAEDGQQALAVLEEVPNFDLILMDVVMPVMDGLEATREIRRRELTTGQHIPIIAVTANTANDDRNDCFAAGMDDFVLKPLRPSELQLAIARVSQLQRARTDILAEWGQYESAGSSVARHYDVAINAVAGDKSLLRQVVMASLDEFPELLAAMSNAIAERKFDDLRRAALTMKGSLRLFDARQASSLAMQLASVNDQANVNVLNETLEELKAAFAILRPQLQDLTSWISEELEKVETAPDIDLCVKPEDRLIRE